MNDTQITRLNELEANGNRTSKEEAVRVALVHLKERDDARDAASAATPTDATRIAAATKAVGEAQAVVDKAEVDLKA